MDDSDSMLDFIGKNGPSLPIQLAKSTHSDTILAAAKLSELYARGKIKISSLKVGSSPLYYLPGQESILQNYADHLNEKDKRAYDLLKEKKIMRDNELDPLTRVTLRSIKDFAVPLEVQHHGSSEIFWKWFLLSNDEAGALINSVLGAKKEEPAKQAAIQKRLVEEEKPEEKKEEASKKRKLSAIKCRESSFFANVSSFFEKNKITLLTRSQIRKAEADFTVNVPSAVGTIEYYCKARQKKAINDSDLASAFAQGQLRKLPVLFLTNGKLTKKANEMLSGGFKGMNVRFLGDGSGNQ